MKRVPLFILFFVCLFHTLSAQDTIVKSNGDIVPAKIIEISPSEIKYKKTNFLDGPTYVENKSAIKQIRYSNGLKEEFSAEQPKPVETAKTVEKQKPADAGTAGDYYDPHAEIAVKGNKMETIGAAKYKFENRTIGENEMQKILMKTKDKEIINLVQSARDAHKIQFIGFAAIPLGIASVALLGNSLNSQYQLNQGAFIGSVLCLGGAIACPILSGSYKHKRTMSNKKAVQLYNQRF